MKQRGDGQIVVEDGSLQATAAVSSSWEADLRALAGDVTTPPPYLHKLIMGRVEMDFVPAEYAKEEHHALLALGLVFIPSVAFCLYLAGLLFSGAFLGGPRMLPFFRLALTGGDVVTSLYSVGTRLANILLGPEPLLPGLVATAAILTIVYFTGHWAGHKEAKSC